MKVIVADKISERGVQLLKEQPGWHVVLTTKENLVAVIAAAQALIVRSATRVSRGLRDKAPTLRCVGRAGVGVDNIDLEAATKLGIIVMSTPGGNAVSVAEHTFALMLSLARQVPRLDKAIHEGRWEKSSAAGMEISGKTLGLIGLGRIGSEVAMRAEAFDMRVLGYDPYISEAAAKEFSVELVPLDRLLAESDFVSLHTALSPATQNLINANSLAKMKKGAVIINAARGELIEEAALANALKSGHIGGAGLDVFAVEPPKNSPLVGLPNVVATPHIAGSPTEAQEQVGRHVCRNAVLAGVLNAMLDEKVNVVNAPAIATARGLKVEEETRKREHGFPNTLEISVLPLQSGGSQEGFSAEGTVLFDGSPRILQIEGIPLEAQLEGTILYLRNRDEPGVIGQVGNTLGKLGVNIATFALGRREAQRGADAMSLVRVDGEVSAAILGPIRAIPAITEAKLLHLG